jgi:cytochrome c556
MIKIILIILLLFLAGACSNKQLEDKEEESSGDNQMHDQMMQEMAMVTDNRIALNPPPKQAQHQLMNMRSHVVALQSIIDHLAKDEFEQAAEVSSTALGLTAEMKMMCSAFNNPQFEKLGLEFHNNADKMSAVFKTRDKNKSLAALAVTMNSCVTCHATFKQ